MPAYPPAHSPNDDDDDDALADALADAWIERAAKDPIIRRAALRAAGILTETTSQKVIAHQCGLSASTVSSMVHRFRAQVAAAAIHDPEIPDSIRHAAADFLRSNS